MLRRLFRVVEQAISDIGCYFRCHTAQQIERRISDLLILTRQSFEHGSGIAEAIRRQVRDDPIDFFSYFGTVRLECRTYSSVTK